MLANGGVWDKTANWRSLPGRPIPPNPTVRQSAWMTFQNAGFVRVITSE
jgi:hypothetical protein